MNVKKAIAEADALRPSTMDDSMKYGFLYMLEAQIAETLGEEMPENPFPNDAELLMPYPYDTIYTLYLVSMIDFYNQDTELYANDSTIFNNAFANALAHIRRKNRPDKTKNEIKVF